MPYTENPNAMRFRTDLNLASGNLLIDWGGPPLKTPLFSNFPELDRGLKECPTSRKSITFTGCLVVAYRTQPIPLRYRPTAWRSIAPDHPGLQPDVRLPRRRRW